MDAGGLGLELSLDGLELVGFVFQLFDKLGVGFAEGVYFMVQLQNHVFETVAVAQFLIQVVSQLLQS